MKSRFYTRSLPILMLFAAMGVCSPGLAQLCGYDYHHLYILDIRFEGQQEQAKNISAWLVDEDLRPYEGAGSAKQNPTWQTVKEPVAILPCHEVRVKNRMEFPRAEGHYVVKVLAYGPNEKHPPVYQAMIVAGSDTTVVRLPYEKSLNICFNHLYADHKAYRDNPMQHHDGTPFEPFRIELKKSDASNAQKPVAPDRVLFKLDMDEMKSGQGAEDKTAVKQIRILDHATLAEIQVLKPSYRHYFFAYRQADFVRETDVFGDNPPLLPDLIVTARVESNEAGAADEYKDFFLFNPKKQMWERNALLSDYPNVMPGGPGKPITRLEKKRTERQNVTTIYELKKDKWEILRTETENLSPAATAPVPDKSLLNKDCLSFVDSQVRWLPVLLATDDHYATIRDTFKVQNICIGNVALKPWPGSPTTGFSFPKIIGPKSTQDVFFEKMQATGPDGIASHEDYFSIDTGAGYAKTLSLRYFIAGKNTAVVDPNTGRIIKYREQVADKFTAFELITDENGLPAARGNVLAKSGKRVGQWLFMNPNTPLMPDTVYSKRFILLMGADWAADMVPEIRENGKWIVPEFMPVHEGFQFHCTPATDSIRVRKGDRMADMAFDYPNMQPNAGGQLWLLSPGQSHYYNGAAKVPINYSDYSYVIRWNYTALQKTNTLPMDLTDEIAALAKKFPGVTFAPYDDIPGYYQVNTSGLAPDERQKVLRKIEAEPIVLGLSRIVYPGNFARPTYADHTISVEFHWSEVPSQFAETLARYGFTLGHPQTGGTHFYQATWKHPRFDQDMIDAAGALAREKGIKFIGFNWHMRVEYDKMHEDVQFPYEPK